jgi:hypothetical protein
MESENCSLKLDMTFSDVEQNAVCDVVCNGKEVCDKIVLIP